jgi:hypothetical protein
MTILLQAHARSLIIEEFATWAKQYPRNGRHSEADGLQFYQHLLYQKAELLEFRSPGHDKWPIISTWLIEVDLITK